MPTLNASGSIFEIGLSESNLERKHKNSNFIILFFITTLFAKKQNKHSNAKKVSAGRNLILI